MDELRKLFEAKFPVPLGLVFNDATNKYSAPHDAGWSPEFTSYYNAKFTGFRAAHELLGRDAERYRWLRNENKHMGYDTDYDATGKYGQGDTVDVIQITVHLYGEPEFTPEGRFDYGKELDRAIDKHAALAAQEPK